MPDNFYGNDPSLGLIRAGDQKYSLPDSERDASSSGNTFQVGTGPQPGLPAGRFLPGQIAGALRGQAQAAAAAAAAARPPPPPVSPTPIAGSTFTAGSAAPLQATLPNPATPVSVPSFVTSTGLPNFGSSNLLAQTSVPGTTGGLPNVPNIGSPLQPLLATPSTSPATGTSVPNIGSNLGSQSVFTQLFPSVPDISLPPTATAADGGPILASDSLPRYQGGTEVDAELEARRPEIMTGLMEFLVERGRWTPPEFYKKFGEMPTKDLLREYMAQKEAEEGLGDRFPSLRGFSSPEPSPDAPPETPSFRPPYEIPKNYYPPGYEFPEEGPTELDYDMRLPEQFQAPGEWQAADSGPILASEYLNAGGPVQYFTEGGTLGAGQDVNDPAGDDTSDTPDPDTPGQVSAGGDTGPPSFDATEGSKVLPPLIDQIKQGSLFTGSLVLPFGGRTDITADEAATITADTFDALSPRQLSAFNASDAIRNAIDPFAAGQSRRGEAVQRALGRGQGLAVQQAIARNLQAPVVGSIAAEAAKAKGERSTPGFGFFVSSNAEGGPILASDYLNAGGPVQYFQEGQSVNAAPDYPGEEPGPPGSAVDIGPSATPSQVAGPAADQSGTGSFSFDSLVDTALNALKSGVVSTGVSAAFGPQIGGIFSLASGMNDFTLGVAKPNDPDAGKTIGGRLGQYAANKFGLTISANQAYPGDYGYGLDPDTDFSNQTAFSPTISRYSSDFDVDDPLQGGQ